MASANFPERYGERPIGIIASDPGSGVIALRLAAAGKRVLHLMLAPAERLSRSLLLEPAATVSDIAIECETILLAIEDTALLRKLLIGDADRPGLAADLTPGSKLIDLGMRPPREAQSILGLVGLRGVSVVDAAVIGGSDAIQRGAANVLVGGFPDAVDAAVPVLGELGTIERTGPLGSAQTAAALMGFVEAAHFTARSEAISVGTALGLQSQSLTKLFNEAPDPENVIRFERQANFVRRLANDKGVADNVIAFRRLGPPVEAT